MAPLGSALRQCREERGWGHAEVAERLVGLGFVSQHFTTAPELAQLLEDFEAGVPCVWRCEEGLDFQLCCIACFGIPGMRVSVALSGERPDEAPQAGEVLRACRVNVQYQLPYFAALLLLAGLESALVETKEDLVDILDFMEHGAISPFLGPENGSFLRALREVLPDCASTIGLEISNDLLRQILPKYW
jgi:hypothetical protein